VKWIERTGRGYSWRGCDTKVNGIGCLELRCSHKFL